MIKNSQKQYDFLSKKSISLNRSFHLTVLKTNLKNEERISSENLSTRMNKDRRTKLKLSN